MAEQLNAVAKRGRGRPRKDAMIPPVPTFAQSEANGQSEPEQQEQQPGMGPSNITDDTVIELCREALKYTLQKDEAMKAVKTANGEYRAVLKRAKKLGFPQEAITNWLSARLLNPADLDRILAAVNRTYRLMRLPVGTQLGMWDEHTTIASKIERDQETRPAEELAAEAFEKGYEAGRAGHPIERTGYTEENPHWAEALRGYSKGQRELATEPGGVAEGAQVN